MKSHTRTFLQLLVGGGSLLLSCLHKGRAAGVSLRSSSVVARDFSPLIGHEEKKKTLTCTFLKVDVIYNNNDAVDVDNDSEQSKHENRMIQSREEYKCELLVSDNDDYHEGMMIKVSGITKSLVLDHNLISGITTIEVQMVDGLIGEYVGLVDGARRRTTMMKNRRHSTNHSESHGIKSVLILRVNTKDSENRYTKQELANGVFGRIVGGSDKHTLASQFMACSNGKLSFEPATGHSDIVNGVLDVDIDLSAESSIEELENAATSVVREDYNLKVSSYDHVMYCMPPSKQKWLAYGYFDNGRTVYRDQYCISISAQLHEFGHNLNLEHSGDDTDEYGDTSGYMGYSYLGSDRPLMCFNGPKSYQLGWYNDRVIDLTFTTTSDVPYFSGKLIGVVDYASSTKDKHFVIVRIRRPSKQKDLYVMYNRAKWFNEETQLGKDQILITKGGNDSNSNLLQILNPKRSERYDVVDFEDTKRTLRIQTLTEGTEDESGVDYVRVSIGFACSIHADCLMGEECTNDICIPSTTHVQQPQLIPPSDQDNENVTTLPLPVTELVSSNLVRTLETPLDGTYAMDGIMFDLKVSKRAEGDSISVSKLSIHSRYENIELTFEVWTKQGT